MVTSGILTLAAVFAIKNSCVLLSMELKDISTKALAVACVRMRNMSVANLDLIMKSVNVDLNCALKTNCVNKTLSGIELSVDVFQTKLSYFLRTV